ncbi:unnamed protein product [Wuchereria bancrofti]|uniref:Prenyltransferase alpha-alpha toroid domain-containing protein n=4 Tax=Wuchereria bancrofti TaxID=6293 RepID=A0A3P7E0G1_WUCBA|nr:unnamed protein product [Wuchereria bancrofti]
MSEALLLSQHLKFLRRHLITLPANYRSFDSNRAAILYFTLSTLDVLGKLEEEVDAELREKLIEWIYRLQLKSDSVSFIRIMGFCAPPAPHFGFLDTGCSVLGGIKINPTIQDQGSSCPSKDFYVSQYNLAHHWQRPHMVPHSVGFPQLLARTMPWVQDCLAMRHAGHWPFETHSNRLKNRNLLEVFEDPSDGSVILWSVNELSTRKRLLEFRLNRLRDEEFDEWKIVSYDRDEDQESYNSERTKITERNWNTSTENEISMSEEQFIHNHSSNNPKYCRTLDVSTALLELRSYKSAGERCRILARSEKELYLCDPENNTVSTLFHHHIHSLSFIPYMNDEIVFLDDVGRIWYGEMGENFIQVKCGYDIESVAGSDHPRLIYAADKDGVHLVDLRVGVSDGNLLYTVPEYDDTSRNSYHFQYKGAFEKERIHQLYSLPDVPQMLLICTSKKFVLVDERMRGLICLESSHSIYHGGHHVTSAPPIRDTNQNGTIYPIFILQHTIHPDVQTFSLYRHLDGTIWSSLASIKRLQEPRSAVAFYREQPKYNIRIPRLAERFLFGSGPTRAISFLNTDTDSDNEKLFLFRMMDDGSLWYEQISIQNDQHLSEKMLWRGASKMKDIIDANTLDLTRSDNVHSDSRQQKVNIFDVEPDIGTSENLFLNSSAGALQPLDTHPENNYPEPEIVRDVADEQLFSKIVLQGWDRYFY